MKIQASNGVMSVGHQLDNLATVISFPISDIIADQGAGGSWSVRIQRNGDVAAYPTSNFSISNNNLNLILTSSDLANVGEGQIQLKYAVGSKVLMSRVYRFYSHYSLDGSGTVPAPWQSWVDAVEADADRAEAAVLHYPYIDSTTKHWMQYNATTEQFVDTGIVAEGQDGEDGEDGADGTTFTPSVSAEGVISWTNDGGKVNPTPVNIKGPAGTDGEDGQDGEDGEDGFSPSATVSKSGTVTTITITDKNGTTSAQVNDGTTPDMSAYRTSAAQDAIDNTLQPKTDILLSTLDTEGRVVQSILAVDTEVGTKADASTTYTKTEVDTSLATKANDSAVIKGVKVAGAELTKDSDGKVNVPVATATNFGIVKTASYYGLATFSNSNTYLYKAENSNIDAKTHEFRPIVPANLDYAIRAGLVSNAQITTDADKKSCCNTIGALCSIPKTAMDSVAVVGCAYYLGSQTTVSIVLPSSAVAGDSITCVFYSGATATTLSISGSYLGTLPTPSTNQRVELSLLYDSQNWCLLSNVMSST